jgi:hypothetical protein
MHMRDILFAITCATLACSCTEDDPCSGIYYTSSSLLHVSYVNVVVEGPGLESMWWEPQVSLWDYPRDEGYPDDEITLTISQAACPDHRIIIEGHVLGDHTLDDITYSTYWIGENCHVTPEARTMLPVSDGSVTYDRIAYEDDGDYITISFNNLRILNREPPPEDPPGLSSIIMNGTYRAPVRCLITP